MCYAYCINCITSLLLMFDVNNYATITWYKFTNHHSCILSILMEPTVSVFTRETVHLVMMVKTEMNIIIWVCNKYIYMCVYVCMCMCMYVCMCVCVYVCICMCAYVCVYVCEYVCECMYVCEYVCGCLCMCVYVCICVCVCVYMCVFGCVCVYVCMRMNLCGLYPIYLETCN